jgi:hypothetical protein
MRGGPMLHDNEAVEPVSKAYAEARDRATKGRSPAFPRIIALLTANGHSPERAAEIVRIAQLSWSKNPT